MFGSSSNLHLAFEEDPEIADRVPTAQNGLTARDFDLDPVPPEVLDGNFIQEIARSTLDFRCVSHFRVSAAKTPGHDLAEISAHLPVFDIKMPYFRATLFLGNRRKRSEMLELPSN